MLILYFLNAYVTGDILKSLEQNKNNFYSEFYQRTQIGLLKKEVKSINF
jgi:hypothetical protein